MTEAPSPPASESGSNGGRAKSIHRHRHRHQKYPGTGSQDKKPVTTIGLTKPAVTSTIETTTLRPSNPSAPLKAAEPVLSRAFDPWNSSSSGHQVAENRLGASTGWRDSRNSKLMAQYASRGTGGQRISDSVGAGSRDYDRDSQQLVRPEARFRARNSVLSMLVKPGLMRFAEQDFAASAAHGGTTPVAGTARASSASLVYASSAPSLQSALAPVGPTGLQSQHSYKPSSHLPLMAEDRINTALRAEDDELEACRADDCDRPALFSGVVVYVNGSTHPHVSDHKLKQLLAEYGGRMSMHLGRRKVTHVILGRPSSSSRSGGAGGGLAGGKLQKEIQKVGGCAVKYVGVEWVLESIKAGKRLPEARFANLKVASKAQGTVYGLCTKSTSSAPERNHTALTEKVSGRNASSDATERIPPVSSKAFRSGPALAFVDNFEPPPSAQSSL